MGDLRERLNNFLKDNGIKQKFICDQTGLKRTTLCDFLKGNRRIGYDKGLILDGFLESKGY